MRGAQVVIADGNTLCRAGLVDIFRNEIEVTDVSVVEDIIGLYGLMRSGPVADFLVLDAELPGLGGAGGVRRLVSEFPALEIVVMVPRAGSDGVEAAYVAGVRGCLLKDCPDVEFAAVLRAILSGRAFFPLTRREPLPRQATAADVIDDLTGRQRAVVEMLSHGNSNRDIGSALGISESTVKVHLQAAFRQMGVRNRADALSALRSRTAQPSLPGTVQ